MLVEEESLAERRTDPHYPEVRCREATLPHLSASRVSDEGLGLQVSVASSNIYMYRLGPAKLRSLHPVFVENFHISGF